MSNSILCPRTQHLLERRPPLTLNEHVNERPGVSYSFPACDLESPVFVFVFPSPFPPSFRGEGSGGRHKDKGEES